LKVYPILWKIFASLLAGYVGNKFPDSDSNCLGLKLKGCCLQLGFDMTYRKRSYYNDIIISRIKRLHALTAMKKETLVCKLLFRRIKTKSIPCLAY
jgi:hypothetical protein